MNVKKIIYLSRLAKKWTQKEVSERAKVTVSAVRRMEEGGSVNLNDLERVLLILNDKAYQKLILALTFDAGDLFSDPVKQFEFMENAMNTQRVRSTNKANSKNANR
jgi:transcriptional regulator with XRE-family HTH domain